MANEKKDYEFRQSTQSNYFYSGDQEGIRIEFDKKARTIDISGWYHGRVGIEGSVMPIREFLAGMGILINDLLPEQTPDEPTK